MFLGDGGSGYDKADQEEDNPKNSGNNWKLPQRDGDQQKNKDWYEVSLHEVSRFCSITVVRSDNMKFAVS